MAKCLDRLTRVHDNLSSLPVEIAVDSVRTAGLQSQEEYFNCARKHAELVRWIEDGR